MATDSTPDWGRPRSPWSQLGPSGRAAWSRRGRPYGLTGRQAHAWARARPSTRERYRRFAGRFGLRWYEVYGTPELVRAERRKVRPGDVSGAFLGMLARPWRYTAAELQPVDGVLQRAARTDWGLAIAERQDPPTVRDPMGLTAGSLGRCWLFLLPDDAPFLADEGPWHHSLTFREEPPNHDVEAWVAETGIYWTVLAYIETRGAFIWAMWWPETSPGGGNRHEERTGQHASQPL